MLIRALCTLGTGIGGKPFQGFPKEQLAEVKQQAAEALDIYIRGSYSGWSEHWYRSGYVRL